MANGTAHSALLRPDWRATPSKINHIMARIYISSGGNATRTDKYFDFALIEPFNALFAIHFGNPDLLQTILAFLRMGYGERNLQHRNNHGDLG
jgi:hypothetical protein